jgi:hypothetical protein
MTDAPEAPRQEREVLTTALNRLRLAFAPSPGPGGSFTPRGSLDELALSASDGGDLNDVDFAAHNCLDELIHAAEAVANQTAAGYVTPEAHAAALREAWEALQPFAVPPAPKGDAE